MKTFKYKLEIAIALFFIINLLTYAVLSAKKEALEVQTNQTITQIRDLNKVVFKINEIRNKKPQEAQNIGNEIGRISQTINCNVKNICEITLKGINSSDLSSLLHKMEFDFSLKVKGLNLEKNQIDGDPAQDLWNGTITTIPST